VVAPTEPSRQPKQPDTEAIVGRSRRAASAGRQQVRRIREWTARRHAARFAMDVASSGCSCRHAAEVVGVRPRTLAHWRCCEQRGRLACRPRGRPCKQSSQSDRQCMVEWLQEVGPQVGLPTMQTTFPSIPRCELVDLQRDYRREFRQANRVAVEELTWYMPGRVWAMDHAEPPRAIDGIYEACFSVRDLASGLQLAWLPVPDETAETTAGALVALFIEHGPPLVLKSDNGSPFKSGLVGRLLADWGIVPLRSPPVTPRYNGSCEAGIGAMKVRTHYEAARNGCAGVWTSEDLEAARRQANEYHHPQGHTHFTPHQLWQSRAQIAYTERERFHLAVEQARRKQQQKRKCDPKAPVTAAALPAEYRRAVRQTWHFNHPLEVDYSTN
jgi:transposase InsO family protein